MAAIIALEQLPVNPFQPAYLDACHVATPQAAKQNRRNRRGGRAVKTCFACGETGHVKRQCPMLLNGQANLVAQPVMAQQHTMVPCDIMTLAPALLTQKQLFAAPINNLTVPHMCPGSPSTIGRTSSWASMDSYAESYSTEMSLVTVSTSSLNQTGRQLSVTPSSYVATPPLATSPPATTETPQTNANGFFVAKPGALLNGRYSVVNQIGKGTFATVVSADDMTTGRRVAIKIVRAEKSALADAEDEMAIMEEITHAFAHSPNAEAASAGLVLLLDTFTHGQHKCLVQPLCGPSLFAGLQEQRFVGHDVGEVLKLSRSLIAAVLKFHLLGFVHCDLKPENILRTCNPSAPHCTLVDYGCSYRDTDRKPRLIQTLYYRAPEVVLSNYWSFAVDMWSVGCIIFELLAGSPLFQIDGAMSHIHIIQDTVEEAVPQELLQNCPSESLVCPHTGALVAPAVATKVTPLRARLQELGAPAEMQDLLAGLLHIDPKQRLKAHEALQHPAFSL
eukprot:TRINITY_DN18139_c0_g1_i1.p1 TRINITY_DN18139_c0_g1~~TRINITY_DN18139_c0_g1_i1.p1  ORF type:complete len:505 (+),score=170.41 TRINITY_DN18139_c0_g1_i1:84-1598(+)